MTDLDRILEVAQEAGRQAAHLCRAVTADTPESMDKGDKSPVTIADYGSQAVILRLIKDAFPDHGVISEEGSEHLRESAGEDGTAKIVQLVSDRIGQDTNFEEVCSWIDHAGVEGAEYTWAIDPIDGTKGFLRRQQYAVAIGLMKNGVPFAGVMVCPNLPVDMDQPDGQKGVLFVAMKDRGTYSVPVDGGSEPQRIHVSQSSDPKEWKVLGSVESAHGDPTLVVAMMEEVGVGGGFVRYDSQVKYGVVANGTAEIYVRPRSKPDYRENIWDHVAGVIVCEEAGGRVTDVDGKDLDFTLGKKLLENRGILATSGGAVHDAVVAGLAAAEKVG
ncbi:MAG: 3'(2'),5'-bisphosphate nucleotidase [Planctomycetota bacterium]